MPERPANSEPGSVSPEGWAGIANIEFNYDGTINGRATLDGIARIIREAAAAEREACATVAEEAARNTEIWPVSGPTQRATARSIAAAIRNRGKDAQPGNPPPVGSDHSGR